MTTATFNINQTQYLELEKIALGAFYPLSGFMNENDFNSVVDNLSLSTGEIFPLPVILDINNSDIPIFSNSDRISLIFQGTIVGSIAPTSIFSCDKSYVAHKIFGTDDPAHPGVDHFFNMGDHFVGGPVVLDRRVNFGFSEYELTPQQTKSIFSDRGWKTIVGFQTRNVPHRAHEYLIRLALELSDGVFVQPLVGRKKVGDYTPESILTAYNVLKSNFLPQNKLLLGVLSTSMRYAGPREAVFHAIIRRNYGCTHFIVGRDHAGVGSYYGKYDAHNLCATLEPSLGINILRFSGPFFCNICDGIVTERTCPHISRSPGSVVSISGTAVREAISNNKSCSPRLVRPEILKSINGIQVLIDSEAP